MSVKHRGNKSDKKHLPCHVYITRNESGEPVYYCSTSAPNGSKQDASPYREAWCSLASGCC